MEILLVEDNRKISEFLLIGLNECGFTVTLAEKGTDARTLISQKKWDIILMDIMLPDIDGLELLQYTRFKKNYTPIIVLSALSDVDDKIKALDYGADDYLSKPFHFKELVARIHALVRRSKFNYEDSKTILECDDLKLHTDQHRVVKGEKEIKLTSQEFKLLKLLLENKDTVVYRSRIQDAIWGSNYTLNTNVMDVCVSYLRKKIDPESPQKRIETVKGYGYIIRTRKTE